MSLYYPQCAVVLGITWENFGNEGEALLNDIYKLPILARRTDVEINDYTEADTFNLDIDYKSFPFDPRCIRSCRVTIHMEDRRGIFKSNNSLNLLVPSEDNTIFVGYVDEESIKFDDDTRTVSMEGRDLTCLFTDVKYLGPPISLSKPIDQILYDLFKWQKATESVVIDNRTGSTLPILSDLAGSKETADSFKNPKRGSSIWDMIQDILKTAGLIGYIEKDKFVITKPRNLYQKDTVKRFIYGKNLKDLSFSRKLGRHKDFNVLIRSINLGKKELITAKIPLESKNQNIGGGVEVTIVQLDKDGKKIDPPKAAEYLVFDAKDIVNKEKLIEIGEGIFEELSRQQIEGSLMTYEMEIPESKSEAKWNEYGNPVKFSEIKNGTAIMIGLEQFDLEKIKTFKTINEKKRYLIKQQFEPRVAEALALSLGKTSMRFYTKSVKFSVQQDQGFEMKIEFINFIELDNSKMVV